MRAVDLPFLRAVGDQMQYTVLLCCWLACFVAHCPVRFSFAPYVEPLHNTRSTAYYVPRGSRVARVLGVYGVDCHLPVFFFHVFFFFLLVGCTGIIHVGFLFSFFISFFAVLCKTGILLRHWLTWLLHSLLQTPIYRRYNSSSSSSSEDCKQCYCTRSSSGCLHHTTFKTFNKQAHHVMSRERCCCWCRMLAGCINCDTFCRTSKTAFYE